MSYAGLFQAPSRSSSEAAAASGNTGEERDVQELDEAASDSGYSEKRRRLALPQPKNGHANVANGGAGRPLLPGQCGVPGTAAHTAGSAEVGLGFMLSCAASFMLFLLIALCISVGKTFQAETGLTRAEIVLPCLVYVLGCPLHGADLVRNLHPR